MTATSGDIIPAPAPDWIALVREKVEGLRYGVVQLVVHDGRVTQIERTEKTRLLADRDASGRSAS
ncbi:MAG: YezD family protein [Verrucomicrobiota bacterium]